MNLPLARMYRLAPRGGGGLACDKAGVALGPADLARIGADAAGRRRCEVRPRQGLGRIVRYYGADAISKTADPTRTLIRKGALQ